MSEAAKVETPAAPAEQVLGAAVPAAEPAKATEPAKPAAPANANGTAPATGQTQAEANAKAAEEKLAKETAARKELDDKKAAEDKAIADKHAADKLWGEWKPKAPEGVELDEKLMKDAVPLFRELGLKPEQAQKLVDFQAQGLKSQQASAAAFAQQVKGKNLAALKADPVLGGDKWDNTLRVANKAVDKYGSPELKQLLADPILTAHPALFRFMHAIGVAMADDKLADGAGLGGSKTLSKGLESLFNHPTSKRA